MLKSKRINAAFSLLELVLVLAIIAVIIGFLLPKGFDALRSARLSDVQTTVETLETAITDYLSSAGGNGSLPRTEGTGIPTSGAALTAATDAAKGNAARLDAVLLAVGKLPRPISLRTGSQVAVSSGTGNEIEWNQALQAFVMTPDAAPAKNWSAVTRAEARVSNPALAPSAAQGANFRTRGASTNLPANVTVAYLVIPNCPAKDAYELAVRMNGAQMAPVEGAASDLGTVAYAAPVNGLTDVYVYLADL